MSKKICLLTPGAYPVPATEGGAVENLTEILAENYQSSDFDFSLHIISIYSESAVQKSKNYDKVKFHFIRVSNSTMAVYDIIRRGFNKLFKISLMKYNPYLSKAIKIINENKFDCVILENALFFVDCVKELCDCKTVLHLHNDYDELTYQDPKELLDNVDLVIPVSDFVDRNLRKKTTFKAPTATVKNVIDTEHFWLDEEKTKKAKEIRQKFGFSDDDIVCLFVGRLVPEKGIGLLIDAMEKVENKNVKLLVVGGSAFSDSSENDFVRGLHEKADKLNGRVAFAGFVSYKDLPPYYHACDVAVFPSQCDEAAGLVLLEAQSAGKPVIAANSGGMSEFVNDKSAMIIEKGDDFTDNLADAIIKLSESDELRERMGNAGLEFSKGFGKDTYLKNLIDAVYKTK